jgi:hypothetical protein
VLTLGQLIPLMSFVVPGVWVVQVLPALVVARIVPNSPTAKHVLALGQLIPKKSLPWGRGISHSQPPAPETARASAALATALPLSVWINSAAEARAPATFAGTSAKAALESAATYRVVVEERAFVQTSRPPRSPGITPKSGRPGL